MILFPNDEKKKELLLKELKEYGMKRFRYCSVFDDESIWGVVIKEDGKVLGLTGTEVRVTAKVLSEDTVQIDIEHGKLKSKGIGALTSAVVPYVGVVAIPATAIGVGKQFGIIGDVKKIINRIKVSE